MTKVFCPHCGNKTLKKVAVSVSDDGSLHMHFSRNPKVLNPRGLRVSTRHRDGAGQELPCCCDAAARGESAGLWAASLGQQGSFQMAPMKQWRACPAAAAAAFFHL